MFSVAVKPDYVCDGYAARVTKAAGSLWLLRHGKTRLNGEGEDDKIRGHLNVPLDDVGRKQADDLAQDAKAYGLDTLHSSDLARATQTAKPVADASGIGAVETSDAYRPWNLGDFQGESSKSATPQLRAYVQDKPDEAVPGGESFNDFKGRFIPAFEKLLAEARSGKTVGLVTHYRNAKLAQAYLDGGADGDLDLDAFLADDLKPAQALKITPDGDDGWSAAKVEGGSSVRKTRRVVAKDMPAPGDTSSSMSPADVPSVPLGPTLNSSHVDRPLPDLSVAYVRAKRKRRVRAKKETPVLLVKADRMRQIIYGVALEPDSRDSQGDVVRAGEIEKAAHGYLAKAVRGKNSVHKIQHGAQGFFRDKPGIVPVESFIAPADFQYVPGGEVIRKGSWVLAAKVEDPALWSDILAGKFTGWSVGGSGIRTPLDAVAKDEAPQAIPPPVNVTLHIDKDAFNIAPPAVTVHNHIPGEAEHHVHVAPSPAPDVHVDVAAPEAPVVHNHVVVEARKPTPMRARTAKDGSRVYEPVDEAAA